MWMKQGRYLCQDIRVRSVVSVYPAGNVCCENFPFLPLTGRVTASRSGVVGSAAAACAWTLALALAVLLHARQTEWTARLDFLWQAQARDEKRDMDALQVLDRDTVH